MVMLVGFLALPKQCFTSIYPKCISSLVLKLCRTYSCAIFMGRRFLCCSCLSVEPTKVLKVKCSAGQLLFIAVVVRLPDTVYLFFGSLPRESFQLC